MRKGDSDRASNIRPRITLTTKEPYTNGSHGLSPFHFQSTKSVTAMTSVGMINPCHHFKRAPPKTPSAPTGVKWKIGKENTYGIKRTNPATMASAHASGRASDQKLPVGGLFVSMGGPQFSTRA